METDELQNIPDPMPRPSDMIFSGKAHGLLTGALILGSLLLPQLAWTAPAIKDAGQVPHLDENGREAYRNFLAADPHRAFAISPGGGWAWRSGMASAKEAQTAALAECAEQSLYPCVPYATDSRVVFDGKSWPRLWGPYLSAGEAKKAREGLIRGMRFPNLVLTAGDGHRVGLSDWRGKVVVLHFWGSWCPPCQKELPDLTRLVKKLERDPRFLIATTQMRESPATARNWLRRGKLELPFYDSGERSDASDSLRLADGSSLQDRLLSPVFPTTYILDRQGIVVFSHQGPVSNWLQYLPFLEDVALRSGE